MPYVPRNIAPLSGLGVDFNAVPKSESKPAAKPTVPYRVDPPTPSSRSNPMAEKLSMQKWDVDPLRVMKQILGKEYKADEHSGMVSNS